MAKPILIVKIQSGTFTDTQLGEIVKEIMKRTDNEYHVIAVTSQFITEPSFECLNDCKGLKDVDIEKLINEYADKLK